MNHLHRSTSPIEKGVASVIESGFPSYLKFDLDHLRKLQDGKNWRSVTHPSLEIIGVSCFGLLKSINFIEQNKNLFIIHDVDQRFKSTWMHFGLLFETMNHLLDHLLILHKAAGIEPDTPDKSLTLEELEVKFTKWARQHYLSDFEAMVKGGKPISFNPHPEMKDRSLRRFVAPELLKEYKKHKSKLHVYRNYYVHNPGVALLKRQGTWWVLRRKHIDKSSRWSTMVQHVNSRERGTYFEAAALVVQRDLQVSLELFERIFSQSIIPEYERLVASDRFASLSYGYNLRNS